MKESNFISILSKELTGELSPEELKQLNDLKANYAFNEERGELRQSWDTAHAYRSDIDIDINAAFNKFSQKYNIPIIGVTSDNSGSNIKSLILNITVALSILLVGLLVINNFLNTDNPTFKNNTNEIKVLQASNNIHIALSPGSELEIKEGEILVHNGIAQLFVNTELKGSETPATLSESKSDIIDKLNLKQGFNFAGLYVSNQDVNQSYAVSLSNSESTQHLAVLGGNLEYGNDLGSNSLSTNSAIDITDGKGILKNSDKQSASFNLIEKTLNFNNTPIESVFTEMENYFGVDIEVNSDFPQACHFTAENLQNPSIKDVFALLHTSFNMGVNRIGLDKYEVYNVSCK